MIFKVACLIHMFMIFEECSLDFNYLHTESSLYVDFSLKSTDSETQLEPFLLQKNLWIELSWYLDIPPTEGKDSERCMKWPWEVVMCVFIPGVSSGFLGGSPSSSGGIEWSETGAPQQEDEHALSPDRWVTPSSLHQINKQSGTAQQGEGENKVGLIDAD